MKPLFYPAVILSAVMLILPRSVRAAQPETTDLAIRIAAAGDAAKHNADAVIVLDETRVTVRPNGIGEAESRRVTKILREVAIRSQCVHRFEFDPNTNTFVIKAVRVHRADGRVEDVSPSAAVQQPQSAWGIFWRGEQLVISVPRLEIGDAVETVTVKTGFNVAYLADGPPGNGTAQGGSPAGAAELQPPMPGHWYDEVPFYSDLPIIEKRYVVRAPRDKPLQYEVYNGELRTAVALDGDHVAYTFEKSNIAPLKHEPRSVAATDACCKLVLATLPDWKMKSRWFHEKNEPSFAVDDAIRKTVRDVVSKHATDEEKITALNHWVAENIRYVGTSRGACEGYTTHAATETYHDRGGVCKDKAGLLVAMLREAGFDSYIVMTQAGSDVTPVPADQFNHAVTCIRGKDGGFRLLDPTWMPKSRENWPSAESLQNVVYGVPEGVDLSRSAYSGPENSAVTWTAESELTTAGDLQSKLRIETLGSPETMLRRTLNRAPPADRDRIIDEQFQRLSPAAMLSNVTATDPVDFSAAARIEAVARVAGFVQGSAARRFMPLPALRQAFGDVVLSDFTDAAKLDTRTYPVRLRATRRLEFRESIRLPVGWAVADCPKVAAIDGPAASFQCKFEPGDGRLTYECRVDVKKHRVPVDEYTNFKQAIDALQKLATDMIVLNAEAGRAGI